jgi:peroxiredoxin
MVYRSLLGVCVGLLLPLAAAAQPAPVAPTVPSRPPTAAAATDPVPTVPVLLVGDRAPELRIQRWVKGMPVEKLESGRCWIVEFWASWCKPCAGSIPRLTDLQARYKERGLTVIGVASQEVAAADLDRYVAAQGDRLSYTVALDNNGASHQKWMTAAGQSGIPTAFLIDREGRIAWIGHPLEGLEEATLQVIEGRLDVAAAAAKYKSRLEVIARAQPTIDRFREHLDAGEHAAAIQAADELVAMNPQEFGQYAWLRFQIMTMSQKDYTGAYQYASETIDGILRNNADVLALLAATICDDLRIERRDFGVAGKAASRADVLTGGTRPDVITVLARVAAEAGDFSRAVELQSKALTLAGDSPARTEMERRLNDYRARATPK